MRENEIDLGIDLFLNLLRKKIEKQIKKTLSLIKVNLSWATLLSYIILLKLNKDFTLIFTHS